MAISRDEAGKWRQSKSDAQGRLVEVIDDPANAACGSASNSGSAQNYVTKYAYNALDNLLTVSHKVGGAAAQTRTFSYDGAGRLLSAQNRESGSVSYGYDANSNLISRTDVRGVTASDTYL